ncbi:DUF11 domain-containing protein [Streptomyces tricolor]|nr:DUF11 domain-containing protein [Streptomyces tricolor]
MDLAVRAPGTVPRLTVGDSTTVRVDVVNNGPAASPGTRLTIAVPPGVRVTRITRPGGTCDATALQCDVGVVPPGTTVPVDVSLTGGHPRRRAGRLVGHRYGPWTRAPATTRAARSCRCARPRRPPRPRHRPRLRPRPRRRRPPCRRSRRRPGPGPGCG